MKNIQKKFEFPDRETAQKEFNRLVQDYDRKVGELEQELVDFALEWDFYLYLGDCGNGRTLCLEDYDWDNLKRGEWMYSSQTC